MQQFSFKVEIYIYVRVDTNVPREWTKYEHFPPILSDSFGGKEVNFL